MELKFNTPEEFKTAVTYLESKYCYTQYNSERTLRFYFTSEAESAFNTCVEFLNLSPVIQ